MKAMTILLSVVPGIECHLGLIEGGYGVIEAIKNPYGGRGFAMSRLESIEVLCFLLLSSRGRSLRTLRRTQEFCVKQIMKPNPVSALQKVSPSHPFQFLFRKL